MFTRYITFMPKEELYLKFVQLVILANTFVMAFGVYQVLKGNKALHKKIQGFAVVTTLVGVVGLVVTLLLGWDYSYITSPTRLLIHRCFSIPLLLLLIATAIMGLKEKKLIHRKLVFITTPFWFGTLITGTWFFW